MDSWVYCQIFKKRIGNYFSESRLAVRRMSDAFLRRAGWARVREQLRTHWGNLAVSAEAAATGLDDLAFLFGLVPHESSPSAEFVLF
ncbi:MAG: hypothetical protein OEM25_03200 [Gammaproteobacteria bacterium]|nr:hypothetical protein [Gammaproteobacteria bacterium]